MSKKLAAFATIFIIWVQVCLGQSVHAEGAMSTAKEIPVLVKATWIWDTTLIIKEPKKIMAYAKKEKINQIYLQVDASLNDASYRTFIKLASAQGVEIHALAGDLEGYILM